MTRLPADQREVLALHYAVDLTLEHAARTLGIPLGTVKSGLHAGLRQLRDELVEDER